MISEAPRSYWRSVVMAFMPAVPPPTMTCRVRAISPLLCLASELRQLSSRAFGREGSQPIAGVHLNVFNGCGWAGLGTGWTAIAEIALKGFLGVRIIENGAVWAGNRTQLAPHAHVVLDHFSASGRDGDGLYRAGHHTPGFSALRAGIGRITGMGFKRRDPDHRLGWLKGAGLHIRAGEFTPHAASAPLWRDVQNFHSRSLWAGVVNRDTGLCTHEYDTSKGRSQLRERQRYAEVHSWSSCGTIAGVFLLHPS